MTIHPLKSVFLSVTPEIRFPFSNLTIVRPGEVAVVWLRCGNCRTAVLLAAMERAWPEIVRQLDDGSNLIEVY
jgi:predicted nuclease of predicted toxin-antitoxin system